MTIKDVIEVIETWASPVYAEEFDNVGLLTGQSDRECTGTLVVLDTLEVVVEEAISEKCNLIISFHPILFSGLKKITGADYVQRTILKAIQNDIAIYAIHTALDNHKKGVNYQIGKRLQLSQTKILIPQKNTLKKLTVYAPSESVDSILKGLHDAGAGAIGNYDQCSFSTEGEGRFRGNDLSQPRIGKKEELKSVNERQINIVFQKHKENQVLNALFSCHPYEEIAYEIVTLENANQDIGMGLIGLLPEPMDEKTFLNYVKSAMNTAIIRHSPLLHKPVKKVAVLGGSGSFAIGMAKKQCADAFITADLKYHHFFEAENQLLLSDVGHFESEQFTKKLMYEYLAKKLTNFAVVLSQTNTNPINYF